MTSQYSKEFIAQTLVTIYSLGLQSMTAVAHYLNQNHHTPRDWMKKKSVNTVSVR